MQTLPLLESASATVNGDGRATVRIGPIVYGDTWEIEYASVSNTGASKSRCDIFQNLVADSSFLEATRSGNRDTTDTKFLLEQGGALMFAWSAATPGSVCMAVVRGKRRR